MGGTDPEALQFTDSLGLADHNFRALDDNDNWSVDWPRRSRLAAQKVHGICDHSAIPQLTAETARTGAPDHSTHDGPEGIRDTPTGGLKPPLLREVRVRPPPRAP
jgi:hypothetical protein